MTQETRIVFNLQDISTARIGCLQCRGEISLPLKHEYRAPAMLPVLW